MKIELTEGDLFLIIYGMTAAQYPEDMQKAAFDLVARLRALLREPRT
jgi:hypothetical protein